MKKLFTVESVSEGHPDKVADRISDAILDAYLTADQNSHVGCETLVTTGQVVVAGEVKSSAIVDVQNTVRRVIRDIGYDKAEYGFAWQDVSVINLLHQQSPDIDMGITKSPAQGAGDQGMMFGYATNETKAYVPFPLLLVNTFMSVLAEIRHSGLFMKYLRPDAKCQVTVETDGHGRTVGIDTMLVSTQHDVFGSNEAMCETIENDIREKVLPAVWQELSKSGNAAMGINDMLRSDFNLIVNPTGRFVIGGPHGDAGLTGRKIIADTYGGYAPHGGGAFSGKDPSKVDRSAAYMARYIAKNFVAAGICDEMTLQLAYAIGMAEPVSVSVNTVGKKVSFSDEDLAGEIMKMFDLTPEGIIRELQLKNPIYEETATYGHFGREEEVDKVIGAVYFPWESLGHVDDIRRHFAFQM